MKTVALLVYRSLRQHALSTWVTAAALALSTGLLMTVWVLRTEAAQAFDRSSGGWDAVLGARSSKLQLVLNALFHLEVSPGNIGPDDLAQIRQNPAVLRAVPLAMGDNYLGWRIVGTTPEFFERGYAPGRDYALRPGGRWFDPAEREAVVGALAARRLGWSVGAQFQPYHGLLFDPATQHEEVFTVVGVLAPTGTPVDRVIWVPLAGVQTMSGHDPAAAHDVSAVLVQLRTPAAGFMLDLLYNRRGNRLTFAWPVDAIVADFFSRIGWFERVLTLVAGLVALVSAAAVFAGIYNSMSARRRDLAILRALGARRRTVCGAVLAEAAAIGVLGALLGFAVYGALLLGAGAIVRENTGVVLDVLRWHPVLAWAPAVAVGLGALAGLVPAWQAYRVPVVDTLAPLN